MAKQAITTTPTALSGLTADQNYTVQCRSAYKTYIQTTATAPTDSSEAFIVGTNGVVTAKRTGSNNVYVWADTAGGNVVFEQSV